MSAPDPISNKSSNKLSDIHALLVTQDESIFSFLAPLLKKSKITLLHAAENKAALKLISLHEPLLVFCDTKSDKVDVKTILRELEVVSPQITIVAIAKNEDVMEAVALLRRGVHDYISLPLAGKESSIEKVLRIAILRGERITNFLNKQTKLEETNLGLSQDLHQLKQDQEAGRYVQLKIFPETPAEMSSCILQHKIIPSLYLSGDFIEYFPLNEHQFVFYLADVSGHGASSAFITILLKLMTSRFRDEVREANIAFSPKYLLEKANEELLKMQLGKHLTMFCGVIDTAENSLLYSLAAHYPVPILINNGETTLLNEKALPVGVFETVDYPETKINLGESFSLTLFSDGIMEILPGDNLQEKEKVLLGKVQASGGSMQKLAELLSLHEVTEAPDDIAVLVVRSK